MTTLKKKSLHVVFFTFTSMFGVNIQAEQACGEHQNSCTTPMGWYVGGEFGVSYTDFDKDRLNDLATASGLTLTSSKIDDSDHSGGLFFGYQLSQYLAIEAGYRNLGEYTTELKGTTTDPAQFNQLASTILPESGDGASLGIVVSTPVNDLWKVSGKIGMWDWDSDNDVSASTTVANTKSSGTDLYYGLEASYQATERLQAYVAAVRYQFDRDESTNLSLGLRYFFGSESQKVARKAPVAPQAPKKAAPQVTGPKDSDGDGVYDDKDQCPGTPKTHLVDAQGCTIYGEIKYQHQLVIYYPNNSSTVNASYLAKIQELADFARAKDIKNLQIVGHTSAPGKEEYNQWLSERRAASLQKILVEKHGFSAGQIETLGKGENDLAVEGNTEAAHSKNRRIEVNLSSTGREPKLR